VRCEERKKLGEIKNVERSMARGLIEEVGETDEECRPGDERGHDRGARCAATRERRRWS
jgi:hypothetical protein